jgi:hypothetical protein
VSRSRGIYRGTWSEKRGQWLFERVSDGPRKDFLDYPKASVVVSAADAQVVFAPYASEGLLRSDEFGAPGTWVKAKTGLTGYHVFGVEEDPTDPCHVLTVAQNAVDQSFDAVGTASWTRSFVSMDRPTAKLRGGIEIDPEDPLRWMVGAGGGPGENLNGGVWLSLDGGQSWSRTLGTEENMAQNPQVRDLLQHPEHPDWVVVVSARHRGGGVPGVYSSLARGEAGSFARVLGAGDAWRVTPLADLAVIVAGEIGLHELRLVDDEVRATNLSWSHGTATAVAVAGTWIVVGTEGGHIYRKPLPADHPPGGWAWIADVGTKVNDLEADRARPSEVYAGTHGNGVWQSTDDGQTFNRFNDGLESSEKTVFDLELSSCGRRLYAGTLGGLAIPQTRVAQPGVGDPFVQKVPVGARNELNTLAREKRPLFNDSKDFLRFSRFRNDLTLLA